MPLLGLSSPWSLVCRSLPAHEFTGPLGSRPFPNEVELERSTGYRTLNRIRFILLRLFSPSEFLRRPPASGLLGSEHQLPGFLPSPRCHWKRPLFARIQALASFRPRVFSTSRRFSPLPASWACFIPQPRPGFSRWGLLPISSAARLVTDRSPPAVPIPRSPPFDGVHDGNLSAPRPRSRDRSRSFSLGLSSPLVASLPSLLLQVFPFHAVGTITRVIRS